MTKIKESKNSKGEKLYKFICPGCNCEHAFNDGWSFNHDYDKPTISPSFLQRGFLGINNEKPMYGTCHSFIKDGMIQYLGDCTHDLKNTTVELPEFTE